MALADITVEEKFRGRSGTTGTDASAEVTYIARSPDPLESDLDVKRKVLATAPSVWQDPDGLLDRLGISDFDEQGGGVWYVTVAYAKQDTGPLIPGEGRFSFRTSGGTKHIQYSKETLERAGVDAATNATDHFKAIGVSGSGTGLTIEGADIVVPVW